MERRTRRRHCDGDSRRRPAAFWSLLLPPPSAMALLLFALLLLALPLAQTNLLRAAAAPSASLPRSPLSSRRRPASIDPPPSAFRRFVSPLPLPTPFFPPSPAAATAANLRLRGGGVDAGDARNDGAGGGDDADTKNTRPRRRLVLGIDGGTESVRACFFDATDGRVVGRACAAPYATSRPCPGWAEQDPDEWYDRLVEAVQGARSSLDEKVGGWAENALGEDDDDGGRKGYDVLAMCCDTTCCSVVALSSDHLPLRPCLLWMDARSAPQAKRIIDVCNGSADGPEPALRVNCDGMGPVSAEWLLPKAMWLKENEPDVYARAATICEYQDYVNHRLTGRMVASSCNAAARWHHDGVDVLGGGSGGRPTSLYRKLGMEELANKLPGETLAMGDVVGKLTDGASSDLGLPVGTPVVQGGPDAFVGMVGLGCVRPGQMCLITGSSHLHCVVTSHPTSAPGTWGAYRGAPLPDVCFAEGGQSSTGSLVRWARDLFQGGNDGGEETGEGESEPTYKTLDEEASRLPPGSDGLVALETWQGSRTPHTDPLARGAFVGLTLSHGRAHLYRALLEAVCYGTRACIDALEAAGHTIGDGDGDSAGKKGVVVLAGGVARSELWLQLHADVTGRTVALRECADAPLLGCAILASVGAGVHTSVDGAVQSMVRTARRIKPRREVAAAYDELYVEVYSKLRPATEGIFRAIAGLRGGAAADGCGGGADGSTDSENGRGGGAVLSPSLLAADWSDMKNEVQKCIDADVPRLHVDVFDGVYLNSANALTFGPQMVYALSKRFAHIGVELDVHLCVDRPARYVDVMAEAGATRFVFQWEASKANALEIAQSVQGAGMKCGISIDPSTPVSEIYPLLLSNSIDVVDVLAVEPGFGGQIFNPIALEKITQLRRWRDDHFNAGGAYVSILVDGGINGQTSKLVRDAGADILVAGTSLFRHPGGFMEAVKELL